MANTLEKRPSKIHGKGIFTTKPIKKGEVLYKVPIDKISSTSKPRYARINKGKWVSDPKVLNYINHSCDPNIKLDISKEQPILVALKDIKPNQEITCEYNKTEIDGKKVKCNCNSSNCRGYFLRVK